MAKSPGAKRRTAKLPAGRVGRPPRERAGEVDARILDAARRVFLERGLAGASIDEIASVARAGKPTIYARFPGKEALFAAVAMSNVAATAARFEGHVPAGSTLDERILGAARRVFLERGLAGASIDEIASIAHAGKPTIYARFPNKEALFAAVAMSNVTATAARFEGHVPAGSTLDERLAKLGAALVRWVLAGDIVAVMRLGISEARRFPDLSINVHLAARRRGEEVVGKLLAEAALSDARGALPAFAPQRLATTARFFLDLVVWPILERALFGEKLKDLRAEVEPDVARSVAFFLAACRHGGIS